MNMSSSNKKVTRIALSCDNCRKRKTKCNRQLPCQNCTKLSISHTCNYSSPFHINHKKRGYDSQFEDTTDGPAIQQELSYLKRRIRQLESSVVLNPEADKSIETFVEDEEYGTFENNDKVLIDHNKNLLIGVIPHRNEEPAINLHFGNGKETGRILKPPLPFFSLSKRDPGIHLFWVFDSSPKYGEFSSNNLSMIKRVHAKGLESFVALVKEKYGDNYIKSSEDGHSLSEVKSSISRYGESLGIQFYGDDLSTMSLVEKVKILIPDQSVTSRYLNAFFQYLYPFFPILDELTFRADLTRIMGTVNEITGKIKDLNIEQKSDYGIIATFFYVIRLTFLLWFSNDGEHNFKLVVDKSTTISKERDVIISSPVTLDVITAAEECLRLFDLSNVQDVSILQGLIFARIYKKYAPEAGDNFKVNETQAGDGIIIQVAISMKLNRDPEFFLHFTNDSIKVINLKRKIWHFLVSLDIEGSLACASTLTVDENSNYNTKLPAYSEGGSNILDTDLEKAIIENIAIHKTILRPMEDLARTIINFKAMIGFTEFLEKLSDLELLCLRLFGTLESLIRGDGDKPEAIKIRQVYSYIQIKLFLVQMYFLCHLYYGDLGEKDLEFFYHKKVLTTLLLELKDLSNAKDYVRKGLFGAAFTVMLTPLLNLYCHVSCLVCASLFVRLSTTLREMSERSNSNQGPGLQIVQNLVTKSLEATKTYLTTLASVSQRYFFAWKVNKAHLFAIKIMSEVPYYESNTSWINKAVVGYSSDQLEVVEMLLDSYLSTFPDSEEQSSSKFSIPTEYLVSSPTPELGSLENMDTLSIIRDIQTDNFWCELTKINREADYSKAVSQKSRDNGSNLNDVGAALQSTNMNINSSSNSFPSQLDIFSDNSLFEVFRGSNTFQ